MSAMLHIMELLQSGKVDPFGESIAFLHSTGKEISKASITKVVEASGEKLSSGEQMAVEVVLGVINGISEVYEPLKEMVLTTPKKYENPLITKALTYDAQLLKKTLRQYSIMLMLGMVSASYQEFKKMTEQIEQSLGPGKSSGSGMKQGVVDVINKEVPRENFDPCMHATLLCYAVKKELTPDNVAPFLKSVDVKPDSKRIEKACALFKGANVEQMIQAELMELKRLG